MATDVVTVESDRRVGEVHAAVERRAAARRQRILPVLDDDDQLAGAVPWVDVLEQVASGDASATVDDIMIRDLVVAYPDETLRDVADRMAARQVGVLPVVGRGPRFALQGIITQYDLLAAHQRILEEERHRERVLRLMPLPRFGRSRESRRSIDASPRSKQPI
jgi:CBS-domain-containing membrane protein